MEASRLLARHLRVVAIAVERAVPLLAGQYAVRVARLTAQSVVLTHRRLAVPGETVPARMTSFHSITSRCKIHRFGRAAFGSTRKRAILAHGGLAVPGETVPGMHGAMISEVHQKCARASNHVKSVSWLSWAMAARRPTGSGTYDALCVQAVKNTIIDRWRYTLNASTVVVPGWCFAIAFQ